MHKKSPKDAIISLLVLCLILGIISGVKGAFDKSKDKSSNTSTPIPNKKKYRYPTQEELENVAKKIKSIEKALLTPEYKKKIRQELDKGYEEDYLDPKYDKEYYHNSKIPKLLAEIEDSYIIIIDDEQTVRVLLSFILEDIVKELEKLPEFSKYKFHTGDGDEGCIYPNVEEEQNEI